MESTGKSKLEKSADLLLTKERTILETIDIEDTWSASINQDSQLVFVHFLVFQNIASKVCKLITLQAPPVPSTKIWLILRRNW